MTTAPRAARVGGWMAGVLLLATLTAVLFWPLVATVYVAARAAAAPVASGPGLLAPAPAGVETGGVRRPLGLAIETVRLVLATELFALPLGLVLAFLLGRTDAWARGVSLGVLAVAAFVPLPLHASAWIGAFGNAGRAQALGLGMFPVIAGWPGAAFVHATAVLPWVVLIAAAGFRTVEPELEESALMDWPAWRVALGVTLRRSVGALAGAALAVAVLTAGDMTVTDLLSVRTYAEEAFLQYSLGKGPAVAGAVTLPPLIVLGTLVALGVRGLLSTDPARLPSAASNAKVWDLGPWRVPVGATVAAFTAAFAGLPVLSLAWRAGRVGGNAALGRAPVWSLGGLLGTIRFAGLEMLEPLGYSLARSALAATIVTVLAWALAWVSRQPGPWRVLTVLAVALALAVPGPVAGMALFYAYVSIRPLYDSMGVVVLAAVMRTLPYALIVLWPAVRSIPSELLEAAEVDGLGPWAQLAWVVVPLTRRAAAAAWAVTFALALEELPATNLVTPPARFGETPIAVILWGLLHTGVESHTAGVVLVMLGAVVAAGAIAMLAVVTVRAGETDSSDQ